MRPPSTLRLAALCAALAATPLGAQNVFTLDELVFSASLTDVARDRTGVTTQVITEEQLRNAGNVQLADVLSRQPGITVTRNGGLGGQTDVRIRGNGPGYTAVYIDGILVNDPTSTTGGFNGFSSISTRSVQRVEIIRGSQSAIYGSNAIAGVISITTFNAASMDENSIEQSYQFEIGSYETYSGRYSYQQKFGPLTLSFGMNAIRSGGISAADENNGNLETDTFDANGQNFAINYEVTPSTEIGVQIFRDASNGESDEYGTQPIDGTPGDEKSSLSVRGFRGYANFSNSGWEHELSFSRAQTNRALSSASISAETAANWGSTYDSSFEGIRNNLRLLSSSQISNNTTLSVGFEAEEVTAKSNNVAGPVRPIDSQSFFVEALQTINEQLDISLGLRHDRYSTISSQSSPRISIVYRATNYLTLRSTYATGFRAPSASESLWEFPSLGSTYRGNPNLKPESSRNLELGLSYNTAANSIFEATYFDVDVEDFMKFSSDGAGGWTTLNTLGTTNFKGVEIGAQIQISPEAALSGSYTYTDAYEQSGLRVKSVPRHSGSVNLQYMPNNDLSAFIDMLHVEDKLDFSAIGDNYTVFNTGATYSLNNSAELYLRIENLTNHEYQTARGYGTPDRSIYIGVRGTF